MITRDEELKWAYLLDPCFELTNSAGKPLTDGYIEVYIAGTRNKYYCASDFAGTLHPFQIPLDSLGSNIVLANPDNAYDVYVYNRFGNLIMSRYNVTPADGGAVISNTERINDLEELVVSAVTGLQGQIDDINEALDGKKDKQEEYSVTLTPTQTVSAIMQNENGEIEVIYQEIDLPEEVPNVDIVSPASTINITTHIDEETNTKTFSIDLSDLGHLEYGQFMATQAVYTGANMFRIKGNLNTTLDGKIQLHKGNSYHITVRGYYTCNDLSNTSDTLNYIEYSTFTNMPVNVDNTVAEPQYFEISYDIFKLSADTNYYIAFASSAGTVSNLTVEIHSLSNISVLDPTSTFEEGWGINIVSSVISVDPDIFNDYSTHTEVYEATVTAIQAATSVVPQAFEAGQYINIEDNVISVTGLQPEGDYVTHDELDDAVTAVSSLIPDSEEVQFEEINLNDYALASAIPDVSDFTTHSEVYEAVVTGVQLATSVIPDQLEAGEYVSIENNVITVTGLQPEGDYATNADVYEATVTAVNIATAAIPDSEEVQFEEINLADYALASAIPDVSEFTTHTEVYNVTVTAIETVTAMIPEAQVQSDWTEDDSSDPSYIQNKPNELNLVAGDGIHIGLVDDDIIISSVASGYVTESEVYNATVTAVQTATGVIPDSEEVQFEVLDITQFAQASAIPDVSDFTTHTEVYNATVTAIETVTSLIPASQVQSDWIEQDTTDSAYIQNKPVEYDLVAGNNITITVTGTDVVISSNAGPVTGYATEAEVYNAVVTGVQTATGLIPDVSDMATQTWVNNQGFLTSVPSTYATDAEVSEAIASSITDFVTEDQVTALIPDSEEVQFEELDITQFAQASAIPVVTGFATKSELSDVEATIPTVQLNGDDQVTAINNHEIAGTGGTTYTAGEYISIENDEISVTGLEPLPEIVEMDALEIKAGTNIAIVTGVSDITISVTGIETPDTEDVTFEEVNLSNYALASAIPDVTSYATHTEVYNAVVTGVDAATGWVNAQNYLTSVPNTYATKTYVDSSVSGLQTKLTGINDVQIVASLPVNPTTSTLYLIPEV